MSRNVLAIVPLVIATIWLASGWAAETSPVFLADSITQKLPETPPGRPVVISGSHGGHAAAIFAVKKNVKGVVLNDAGVGMADAGVVGLTLLEKHGIMGAVVDANTARIGLAADTENGKITFANRLAREAGVTPGQTGRQAAELMAAAPTPPPPPGAVGEVEEKMLVVKVSPKGWRIVTMDSNSQVAPENQNDIIMTGSHGGLVGATPAVKYPVRAAFYNDAGVGKDKAGISRLDWLQAKGIIAATVSASSARIGIGLDTYESGVISFVNAEAVEKVGLTPGMKAQEAAQRILDYLDKTGQAPPLKK